MGIAGRSARACLGSAALLCAVVAPARAEVVFCNEFAEAVFVAVAYEEQPGSWRSRGWLRLAAGECRQPEPALAVPVLHYRAETGGTRTSAGSVRMRSWAPRDGRRFAVTDRGFSFGDADREVAGARMEPFDRTDEAPDGSHLSVTIIYRADGKGVRESYRPALPATDRR